MTVNTVRIPLKRIHLLMRIQAEVPIHDLQVTAKYVYLNGKDIYIYIYMVRKFM